MPYEMLKEAVHGAGSGVRQHRTVHILVISQVAISLILLLSAGLLLQSFRRLLAVPPGFQTHNLLTLAMPMSPTRYPVTKRAVFLQQILARINSLPGVRSTAATGTLPLSGDENSSSFEVEGQPLKEGQQIPNADNWVVTPGYFHAMEIPLMSGRDFNSHDTADSPGVVIVDEVLAAKYWPGQNPIGKRLDYRGDAQNHQWCEVIGVVGQVKHRGLEDEARPQFYAPYTQFPLRTMALVIRTSPNSASPAESIRRAVYNVDPDQPLYRFSTMDQLLFRSTAQRRLIAQLMSSFSVFAVFLSALGLFGALAASVSNRTHEIGIRMTLGAQSGDIFRMVVSRAFRLTAAGMLAGLLLALPAIPFIQSLLFHVRAIDPAPLLLAFLCMNCFTLLAAYLPARRAASITPLEALRHE